MVYKSKWDKLIVDREKHYTFCKYMISQFTVHKSVESTKTMAPSTLAVHVSVISITIPSFFTPIPLVESVTLNKNKTSDTTNKKVPKPLNVKESYAQALKVNSSVNVKDVFPLLPTNKMAKIVNIVNKKIDIKKPKINMTTKSPSRKQVIIPMTISNAKTIVNLAN